jgi:hypothetical protein
VKKRLSFRGGGEEPLTLDLDPDLERDGDPGHDGDREPDRDLEPDLEEPLSGGEHLT